MTRSEKFEFFQAAMQRSGIVVDEDNFAFDIDALDAEMLEEIEDLLFEERMLGRRIELTVEAVVATLH